MTWHPGQAYGQDLRDRVLNASGSIAEVAARFSVSKSYVARARSRRRRLGDDRAGAQHNHVPLKLSGLEHVLAARIQATNDQTLEQVCPWLHAEQGAGERDDSMEDPGPARAEPQKKTLHAAEQERPDVALARQAWAAEQSGLAIDRLVFLDETWAGTDMTPTRGRSPKGSHCLGHAPYGHWHTTIVVCALRTRGLVAPWVLDGAINGNTFRAWVQQKLVPVLQPGDLVVMDNLGSHKVADIAAVIESTGAQVRYLPPYSPDYYPIEQVFAKFKTLLRRTAARTREALWSAFGCVLDHVDAAKCKRYICHAGYGQSG